LRKNRSGLPCILDRHTERRGEERREFAVYMTRTTKSVMRRRRRRRRRHNARAGQAGQGTNFTAGGRLTTLEPKHPSAWNMHLARAPGETINLNRDYWNCGHQTSEIYIAKNWREAMKRVTSFQFPLNNHSMLLPLPLWQQDFSCTSNPIETAA
jgi:hypothetical protein